MTSFKQPQATVDDIAREAARYVVHNLGDQLWAGTPVYDKHRVQWNVPLHARSLSMVTVIGEMTLDVYGRVTYAPSRSDLQREVQQQQRHWDTRGGTDGPDDSLTGCDSSTGGE